MHSLPGSRSKGPHLAIEAAKSNPSQQPPGKSGDRTFYVTPGSVCPRYAVLPTLKCAKCLQGKLRDQALIHEEPEIGNGPMPLVKAGQQDELVRILV